MHDTGSLFDLVGGHEPYQTVTVNFYHSFSDLYSINHGTVAGERRPVCNEFLVVQHAR